MNNASRRWVVTTTLNDAILRGALTPIVQAYPDLELVLVTDRVGAPIERVSVVAPPKWSTRLFGRLLPRWILLFREISRRPVERVLLYNAVPHLLLAILPARLFRKPIDLTMIGGTLDLDFARFPGRHGNRVLRRLSPRALRRAEHFFQWMALRYCDRFFTTGSVARAWLIERGIQPGKVFATPGCADPHKFKPTDVERDIDAIIVASLLPRKRPELTIQILEQVLEKRPRSHFVWLGDGVLGPQVQTRIAASPVRDAVDLVGHTEDVVGYYARSKVFLLNSESEGLSGAAMEAMASGTVPVTSDVGDMRDIVRTGETGVLVTDHGRPEPYSEAILQLLSDDERRRQLSQAGRDLIIRNHSYEARRGDWLRIAQAS